MSDYAYAANTNEPPPLLEAKRMMLKKFWPSITEAEIARMEALYRKAVALRADAVRLGLHLSAVD